MSKSKKLARLAALVLALVMVSGIALADTATFHLVVNPAVETEETAPEAEPTEEVPAEPAAEEAEAPAEEEPVTEEPAEDATETDLPAETETPAEEAPAEEVPAEEAPVTEEATETDLPAETEAPAEETPFAAAEEEEAPAITYERDEEGNLILDEHGMPIAIVPEGVDIPVNYLFDENGELVLDENGDPIVTETVPAGSAIVSTLEDLLDPNRYIEVYAHWEGEQLYFGDTATLIAVLHGYDNAVYTLQWQSSADNADWNDIPGANGTEMQVLVTEDNYMNYWRVKVNITAVNETAE